MQIYNKVLNFIYTLLGYFVKENLDQRVVTFHGISNSISEVNSHPIVFDLLIELIQQLEITTCYASQLKSKVKNRHKNCLFITFDDGAMSNLAIAELFFKLNLKATFFITTGLIEKDKNLSWLENKYDKIMTYSDIRKLSDMGFEIGSHTVSHRMLSGLSDKEVYKELYESKEKLENVIEKRVLSLSYPYGHNNSYNERVKSIAKDIGYEYCFTQVKKKINKNIDCYEIPRIGINGLDSNLTIKKKVLGKYDYAYFIEELLNK